MFTEGSVQHVHAVAASCAGRQICWWTLLLVSSAGAIVSPDLNGRLAAVMCEVSWLCDGHG